MRLKKLYDHSTGKPVISGIKVLKAGPVQHFSPSLVESGSAEGWMSMSRGRIILNGEDGLVVYRIVRTPGRYETPDSPSGYEVIHYYDCVKED